MKLSLLITELTNFKSFLADDPEVHIYEHKGLAEDNIHLLIEFLGTVDSVKKLENTAEKCIILLINNNVPNKYSLER